MKNIVFNLVAALVVAVFVSGCSFGGAKKKRCIPCSSSALESTTQVYLASNIK